VFLVLTQFVAMQIVPSGKSFTKMWRYRLDLHGLFFRVKQLGAQLGTRDKQAYKSNSRAATQRKTRPLH